MKTYTISELAKQFQLSRSTLLYYDKIGLLCAGNRSGANYRVYTQREYDALDQICSLRRTGISLKKIKQIMVSKKNSRARILEKRLHKINDEINQLRIQQQLIISLLGDQSLLKETKVLDKTTWIKLLTSAGLSEDGMRKWHVAFEQTSPKAHQDFLEFLGIPVDEIKQIRQLSKDHMP